MTRVERRNAVVTILTVVFLFCWLYVSRVGRLSTFASLFTLVVIEAVE
jgi:hypothetical protein